MRIKALITALVIGSSSVALAAPGPVVRDHRAVSARYDGHGNARFGFRPMPLRWVTLANDTHLSGRAFIKVAPSARKFTKLELRADKGNTQIDKVLIQFANGRTQVVEQNARLTSGKPVTIDLKGEARSIDRIVLVGRSTPWASLDVLAL